MLKRINNEKGLTLIEILAAVVVGAILMVFSLSIMMTSIKNFNEITEQNKLRDEADLVMSMLYKKMYVTKESQIINKQAAYIEIKNDAGCLETNPCIVGYKDGKIYTGDRNPYEILNKDVRILHGAVKNGAGSANGVYEIELTLKSTNKKIEKKFRNKVRTIYDIPM